MDRISILWSECEELQRSLDEALSAWDMLMSDFDDFHHLSASTNLLNDESQKLTAEFREISSSTVHLLAVTRQYFYATPPVKVRSGRLLFLSK